MGHWTGVKHHATSAKAGDAWPSSVHDARRFITSRIAGSTTVEELATDGSRYGRADDPAVIVEPDVIEGTVFGARVVPRSGQTPGYSAFGAFVDGTQSIGIVNQVGGIPIVWATVSAAVRVRVNRRLVAWQRFPPAVERRYYVPFRYLDDLDSAFLNHPQVVDTAAVNSQGKFPSRHPAALMESAVQSVQRDRELLEQRLAESWCSTERSALFIDGSITSSAAISTSWLAVGVVKTHRRLYADGDAFRALAALGAGERSSVFRVSPRARHAVASWYLRIRKPAGRDALFGLVRVEVADGGDIAARADEVSGWILAEGAPLAMPDGRWDKLAYGIRDTEEFLRAIS
ncbi:MAG: hypothetical protein WKF55_13035 [Gemmatimonadaceae bacterium]